MDPLARTVCWIFAGLAIAVAIAVVIDMLIARWM